MTAPPQPWTFTAGWIFPVTGPPLPNGTVTVRGDRIESVDPVGVRAADDDLGEVAVIPGLVNAHTHLDLTGLRGLLPPSPDVTGWLRGVIGHRRAMSRAEVEHAIDLGIRESLDSGTTLLGDISGGGLSWDRLSQAPLRSVVYYEMLGLPRDRARRAWAEAAAWLAAHPATATCRPGLSPHAPYSVRDSLYSLAVRRARRDGVPLCTHLAEFAAELQLLDRHQGPLVDFLSGVGAWDPTGLVDGVNELLRRHLTAPAAAFAHGNYLTATSPVPPGGTVVYCPRTHAAFGHPPHPVRELLSAGIPVAIGTDSLASNPDLGVLNELIFLRRHRPEVSPDTLLRMATANGARALGRADVTGTLAPGKSADAAVLSVEPADERATPYDLLFREGQTVRAVLFRGSWVREMQ